VLWRVTQVIEPKASPAGRATNGRSPISRQEKGAKMKIEKNNG
jgi:hypothetical protein